MGIVKAYIFSRKVFAMINPNHQAAAQDRGAILTKAAVRAAERLNITGRQLAQVLGVSEAQVSRFRTGEAALAEHSKPFELAALLVRTFRSLDAITGGDEKVARAWLIAPNAALGAIPAERIATVQGLADVVTYLDARRAAL
ncbi:MbcA/ParS/Xre antitoxin family protein [Sinirhodobacter sp. WL0062]|uniref:MbcA/ParS/Xre antitoxin family protein n=1 Tax=Rhodobacter flavimaris TaxID=2907145 RepID=A0ABS8YV88_9RHOB|nr:antitoxin Xre/MbcA/ParS toxin-binding domain-containing protein [Sinirhodobacter sp. WL0062]MCE5972422.1 MbcA/ParS/Xre antitoxin family protein [Sinirhodobacter sp. WL0062]